MPRRKLSQNFLPPLTGLPQEIIANLENMKSLPEKDLRTILLEMVPRRTQSQISRLLQKQQENTLTEEDQEKLGVLQKQADLVMLRKAYAAVLLRSCGFQLPTLEELQLQTAGKRKR